MKRYKNMAITCLTVVAVVAGLRLVASSMPVNLEGAEWRDIEKCAVNQKFLYQSIQWYVEENGERPASDFQVGGFPARSSWECPACGRGYSLHPENYGIPGAVVIEDEQDRHSTTFMWWFRGLKPQVQTMGDGTIELFKGGKIMTMTGSKR